MKILLTTILMIYSTCCIYAGTLQLAEKGKALYTIVERPDAARLEKAAVKDLKLYLDKITGADFKIGAADARRIFIGVPAPGDSKPLAKAERRIKAVNGDIYIYGESTDAAAWGIYDLLEEHLGCRWYTAWGDEKIPANADLTVPELDHSRIPPFHRFETASMGSSWRSPEMRDFLRRRRVHITPDKIPGDDDYLLGFPLHTFCKYLPPGHVPKGKFVNSIGDAYKYFTDKKYFKTNPEWFTMDESGKRVNNRQLCLSNEELRKEFLKNLEIVIKNEYKGGDAVIVVDMNDRNNYLCKCPECKKLVKKYATEGGPLYDYLIELAGIFAKKYPRITLRSLAYGCSQVPPNCDLPDNVMMWYAPLESLDYHKSYRTSGDRRTITNLKKHAKRSKALWKWMYVTNFRSGFPADKFTINMQRLADNMRVYHENNIRCIMTEVGLRSYGYINFHEMRMNMIYALKEDLNTDEKAVNREFMEFCYGKAAGKMDELVRELEKLSSESKFVLRWNCATPWKIDYLTPQNLIRWDKMFTEMEDLVSGDPRQLLHVQKARLIFDQVILGKWKEISALDRSFDEDAFQRIRKRYSDTIGKVADRIFQAYELTPEKKKVYRKAEVDHMMLPVNSADMLRKQKSLQPVRPLPPELAGIPADRIMRVPFLPKKFGDPAPDDPEGAFGISMPGSGKLYPIMNFMIESNNGNRKFGKPVTVKQMQAMPKNKFNYYYLGSMKTGSTGGHISTMVTRVRSSAVFDSFDQNKDVDTDFYISIKYDGKKMLWLDELILVRK